MNINENKKRRMTYSINNNVSLLEGSEHSNNKIILDNNLVNNSLSSNKIKNDINLNAIRNSPIHKKVQKKLIENENEGLKKVDTSFNYNLGEHNFIFINISRGSSLKKNAHESATPRVTFGKENMEDAGKGNKRLFSNFSKNKVNKPSKINENNIVLKNEKENFNLQDYMNNYSKEMLNEINSIRKNPQSFLLYIDEVLNNNIQRTNDDVFIVSKNIDEKIKLMEDFLLVFEQIKTKLREIIKSQNFSNIEEFKYNDELEIDFERANEFSQKESNLESSTNNDKYNSHVVLNNYLLVKKKKKDGNSILDLSDDKIANLILDKRRQLKYKYPENVFKMSIIKDIKINILIQISTELFYNQYNDRKMLNEIIFNPIYKNFAVTWANEINRRFISISCFA